MHSSESPLSSLSRDERCANAASDAKGAAVCVSKRFGKGRQRRGRRSRQPDGLHRARGRRGPPGRRVGRERRSCALDRSAASMTETPGSALDEAGATRVQVEIGEDRARLRNGELVVEVLDNPEERFVGVPAAACVSSGRTAGALRRERSPFHVAAAAALPAGRRRPLRAVTSRSTRYPRSASTGSASISMACSTKKGPSSTSSSATPRSRCRSRSPVEATAFCGTCRESAASSSAPTARGGPPTRPGRSTTG